MCLADILFWEVMKVRQSLSGQKSGGLFKKGRRQCISLPLSCLLYTSGQYIVALCGSGMMEECGIYPLKEQERAYRIEERYGRSPEYLYTDAFFNTRTEMFYDFYKHEILADLEPSASTYALSLIHI